VRLKYDMQIESHKNNRLLWSAAELSNVLGVSIRTIRRRDLTAKLPRPVMIGHSVKWKADEIRAWIAARCPDRDQWEASVQNGENN